ncbi:hypothetical protein [Streptomyces sp. NPDC047123]|uniref:hypothetical protein n=1 Tax=Streptomyces sp. NPDC047123 TaxID=3155622 RepID=UPI0033CF28A7
MPKPGPLPAELIPDGSELEDCNAAYQKAKRERVPFVCVSTGSQGTWTAKVDVLSAPVWPVSQERQDLLHEVILGLVAQDSARAGSTGPEYFTVSGLQNEALARSVAAAMHAGLYGDLLPLEELLPASPVQVEPAAVGGAPSGFRASAPVTGWDVIRVSADEAADMDDLGHLVGLVGSAVGQLSVLLARATGHVLDPGTDPSTAAADPSVHSSIRKAVQLLQDAYNDSDPTTVLASRLSALRGAHHTLEGAALALFTMERQIVQCARAGTPGSR